MVKMWFGLGLAGLTVMVMVWAVVLNRFETRAPSQVSSTPASLVSPSPLNDMVVLDFPQEGQVIASPLTIMGKARGSWFFEATFPVVLTDWDGLIIAEGYVTAQSDWMTEEFVPFEGVLEFERPSYGDRGALILQKSNPSGLPENDRAHEIGVRFGE